ncbi:MAG: hypothetical protein LBE67_12955 [Kocuria palustris]|nr:hypothetical protein [Kocuria palustris]
MRLRQHKEHNVALMGRRRSGHESGPGPAPRPNPAQSPTAETTRAAAAELNRRAAPPDAARRRTRWRVLAAEPEILHCRITPYMVLCTGPSVK